MALAFAAPAQQLINFADMPLVASPAPLPVGYSGLNGSNIWYVDPAQYSGSGPGYQNFFTHRDVVFIGGQFCGPVKPGCYGVITSVGPTFIPKSAILAAGYHPSRLTVLACNSGRFVGTVTYLVTTVPQMINFPATWGAVTELQFQADEAGNLVLFALSVYPTL